jgi:hypothetical protein
MANTEQFIFAAPDGTTVANNAATNYAGYHANRDLIITALLLDASDVAGPPGPGYGNSETFYMRLYDASSTSSPLEAPPTVLGPTAGGAGIVRYPLGVARKIAAGVDFYIALYHPTDKQFTFQAVAPASTFTTPSGTVFTLSGGPKIHEHGGTPDAINPVPLADATSFMIPVGLEVLTTGDSVGILLG